MKTCLLLLKSLRLRLLQADDMSDFSQTCQQDISRHVATCLEHVLLTQNYKLEKICLLKSLSAEAKGVSRGGRVMTGDATAEIVAREEAAAAKILVVADEFVAASAKVRLWR